MHRQNRIIPFYCDLKNRNSLDKLSKLISKWNIPVRTFYISNVEAYVYPDEVENFSNNIGKLFFGDDSIVMRTAFVCDSSYPPSSGKFTKAFFPKWHDDIEIRTDISKNKCYFICGFFTIKAWWGYGAHQDFFKKMDITQRRDDSMINDMNFFRSMKGSK